MEQIGTNNVELLYFKGKTQRRMKLFEEAVLTMEELVGADMGGAWTDRAIYLMAKIRTKQKNFYEAYHTLGRLPKTVAEPKIAAFGNLVEGVLSLFASG